MLHQQVENDQEKKSTSTVNFNSVFDTGMLLSSNTIAQYLIKKDVSGVQIVNTKSRTVVTNKLSWKTKIIHDIGPDVAVLRNLGETDEQVYQRHRGIIQGLLLVPVISTNGMDRRMAAYPHYYLREIITDTDFSRMIDCLYSLEYFKMKFPAHVDRVVALILTEPHFSRVIYRVSILESFIEKFPTYTDRTVELALTDKPFTRLMRNSGDFAVFIKLFKKLFPAHVDRIAELALTDKHFTRLMRNSGDFAVFKKLFPAHVDRIAELILTDDHFARLISLAEYPIYSIKKFAKNFSAHYTDRAIKLALTDKFSHYESEVRDLISLDHSQQRNFHQFYRPNIAVGIAELLVNYSKKTNYNFDLYTVLVARAAEEKVINKKEAQSQETVLYSVIKTGQFEKAKILLVEGQADANIQTADGDTALKLAKRLAVCKAFIPSDNLEEILDLLIRGRNLVMSFTK